MIKQRVDFRIVVRAFARSFIVVCDILRVVLIWLEIVFSKLFYCIIELTSCSRF